MLRRVKSASSLYVSARSAATSTTHTNAILPSTSPMKQMGNRSLASAVLLSSQKNWKGETVAGLKMELKKRGLSQQGNKATLVARLSSAETTSFLPPTPTTPPNTRSGSSLNPSHSRSLSTTASTLKPATPKSLPKEDTGADTPTLNPETSVTSSGPNVSTKTTEAPKKDEVTPEQVTSAPGLPVSEVTSTEDVKKMDVELPTPRSETEIEQIIPSTPDNFASNTTNPPPPSENQDSTQPKVMTVASASTHPAGGPVHGDHSASDAHSHELDLEKAATEATAAIEGSIPSFTDAITGIISSPVRAWKSTGLELPKIGMPKSEGGSGEFKASDKDLNDEERRGAYVLGGIAALALLLGGPKKEKKSGKGKEGKGGAVEVVKGVKGDKEWEKASGAGIVGHGARKD